MLEAFSAFYKKKQNEEILRIKMEEEKENEDDDDEDEIRERNNTSFRPSSASLSNIGDFGGMKIDTSGSPRASEITQAFVNKKR